MDTYLRSYIEQLYINTCQSPREMDIDKQNFAYTESALDRKHSPLGPTEP